MRFLIYSIMVAILYTAYAYMNFAESIRIKWWYIPLGILLTAAGNVAWMLVTKLPSSGEELLMRGIIWDLIITATFIVTPFLFFSMRLNLTAAIGLGIAIIGLIVLKIGMAAT